MNGGVVLFDLDMTLLNTSSLEKQRNTHDWSYVRNNLDLVQSFKGLRIYPHDLPKLLKGEGYSVGVVTSSPKWYAETLLKKFQIPYDVLVSYGDTKNHKPEPDPLLLALDQLNCSLDNAYHIGDKPEDMIASYRAGIVPIGAGWGMNHCERQAYCAPDYLIYDSPLLSPRIFPFLGYILEQLFSSTSRYHFHEGSFLSWWDNKLHFYALGRYFSKKDPRHATSHLSLKLIDLKENVVTPQLYAKGIKSFIEWKNLSITMVTCVPPKPNQFNRFAEILNQLEKFVSGDILFSLDGLVSNHQNKGYKNLRPSEREVAIRGAFSSRIKWKGTVLLIDDITTSGSTINESSKVLLSNGADHVIPLVFGKDQFCVSPLMVCPKCGRSMRVRVNPKNNSVFWLSLIHI